MNDPGESTSAPARTAALDELVAVLESAQVGDERARAVATESLDGWLARGYEPPTSSREEARLITAARWMLNDRPDHPVIPVWAARAAQVLRGIDDTTLSARLAAFAFERSIRIGDFGEAGRLVAEMWDRTSTSRTARLTWLPSAALYLWLSGRPDAALAALRPAVDDTSIAPALRYSLLEQAASAALVGGDAARSAGYLDEAEALVDETSSPMDRAHLWFLRTGGAMIDGDPDAVSAAMARCQAFADRVHGGFFHALWRLGGATVRLHAGQARRAERELTDLLGDVVLMRARYLEWSVRLTRAAARFALQRLPAGEADLAAALRIAAENGYVNCDPWGLQPPQRALMRTAIERNIEARTARAILAQHSARDAWAAHR